MLLSFRIEADMFDRKGCFIQQITNTCTLKLLSAFLRKRFMCLSCITSAAGQFYVSCLSSTIIQFASALNACTSERSRLLMYSRIPFDVYFLIEGINDVIA